jgi:GT2 family glycosyltransferase
VSHPAPSVTAIVLHWGETEPTARCLRSLLADAPKGLSVLVVDNSSGENWAALDPGQRIEVLCPPHNEGYAGGNNLGLRTALARGATYALLLNNDARIESGALRALVDCAEQDPRIAIVGSRLATPGEPSRDEGSYGRITYGPFLVVIEGGAAHDAARDVEWVSGCGVLVRLAALAEIGLLDEEFFLYCEDVDWCLRARRRGYRVVYEPRAVVLHQPPSSPAAQRRRAYFLARNGLLFARKHGTALERLKLSAAALLLPAASLLRCALAGDPLEPSAWVARGVVDGLLRRPPRLRQLGLR